MDKFEELIKALDELVKRKWTTPEARAIRIHEQNVANQKVEHTNTGQRGVKAYTSSVHGTAEEQAHRDFRPPAPVKHFKAGSPEVKAHAAKYKQPVTIAKNGQWSLDKSIKPSHSVKTQHGYSITHRGLKEPEMSTEEGPKHQHEYVVHDKNNKHVGTMHVTPHGDVHGGYSGPSHHFEHVTDSIKQMHNNKSLTGGHA